MGELASYLLLGSLLKRLKTKMDLTTATMVGSTGMIIAILVIGIWGTYFS
jgi:hypothetical protein